MHALLRGHAQHQKAHGDPVIEMGCDHAAAANCGRADHDQIVALDAMVDACRLQPCRHCGEPV